MLTSMALVPWFSDALGFVLNVPTVVLVNRALVFHAVGKALLVGLHLHQRDFGLVLGRALGFVWCNGFRHRRAGAVERGKLLEIRARAESGKLIPADEVKIAAFRRARIVRDGMLNLPDRVAALLAAETDVAKVHAILTKEIRLILEEISRD